MVLQFFGIPTAPLAVDPGVRATTAIPTNYTAAALQASPHIENFALPYVAKPSVEGISKKIIPASGTDTHLSSQSPCVNNIVEMHLEGREFCVGILGTGAGARVIGVVEYVFENGDLKPGALLPDYHDPGRTSFIEVINCDMTVPIFKAVAGVGLKAWRAAGCSDAGYVRVQHDVRGENARPCVLEARHYRSPSAMHLTDPHV
jgi:hypothetical protein